MKKKPGILKTDMIRFAYLWIGYVLLLVVYAYRYSWVQSYEHHHYYHYSGVEFSMFLSLYAILCAVMLFGDLYKRKKWDALGIFSTDKGKWFFLRCLSGVIFFLLPVLLFCQWAHFRLLGDWHWKWQLKYLLKESLLFLLYFGASVLSVMLSGSRIGAVCIYSVVNILGFVVQWLYLIVYAPFLPIVPLHAGEYAYASNYQGWLVNIFEADIRVGWWVLYACAAVGILAILCAFLLYRRRAPEQTGKFLAVPGFGFVFAVMCSVSVGTLIYIWMEYSVYQIYYLLLYIAVLYILFRMLFQRSVKVFIPWEIVTFLGFLLLFGGSTLAVRMFFNMPV